MPGLAAAENSPPAAAPPPRRLSSPLPRRVPPSPSPSTSSRAKPRKSTPGPETDEAALDNPDLGPFLLKQARDAMVSGEGGGAARALELAERAARALERRGEGAELKLAMSLHVPAAIHCGLGRHADAIPVLERAVAVVTPPPPPARRRSSGAACSEVRRGSGRREAGGEAEEWQPREEKSAQGTTGRWAHMSARMGGRRTTATHQGVSRAAIAAGAVERRRGVRDDSGRGGEEAGRKTMARPIERAHLSGRTTGACEVGFLK